jgi:hypothetical protein
VRANRGIFIGEEIAPFHLGEHLTADQFELAWARALEGWSR